VATNFPEEEERPLLRREEDEDNIFFVFLVINARVCLCFSSFFEEMKISFKNDVSIA